MSYQIRIARPEDLDGLLQLINFAKDTADWLGGHYNPKDARLDQERKRLMVCLHEDVIVGVSQAKEMSQHKRDMHLVAVEPEYRRRGIGSALYQAWENLSVVQQRLSLTDTVMSNNIGMYNFLIKNGWRVTVIQRGKIKESGDLVLFYKRAEYRPLPSDFSF